MFRSKLFASLPLLILLSASAANAEPAERFIYSGIGPGVGEGVISLGGRAFVLPTAEYIPIPTFEINYVRGLGQALDFELHISTLGLITFADLGARIRLLGDERASLALRADATGILIAVAGNNGGVAGGAGGATPGLIFSFGNRSTQFVLGCDTPMYFGAAVLATNSNNGTSGGSGSGVSFNLRPSATLEFPVGQSTNMYVQAAVWIIRPDASATVMPTLAIGAAW
jgi:hypothetical protein